MEKKYNHGEAYCLMTYRTDDGSEEEVIWNSRDGVTPFMLTLRSGKIATHVDWGSDKCVPDHKPKSGDRIFVDLTRERAVEIAKKNVLKWQRECVGMDGIPTEEQLVNEYMRPGAPDIIVVE